MTQIHKQENAGHGYARLRRQLSIRHWFTIAIGLICLIGYSAYDYSAQWRRSEEYLHGMVRLADEHLSKTVSETQLALSHVTIHLGRQGEPQFADQAALRALIAQEMPRLAYLRSVAVVNTKGELVASSRRLLPVPVNVQDRDYFRSWMAGGRAGGLYVGSPVRPRLASTQDPEWLMPFSLPILAPGGAILGVVVATIDPDYFGRLYTSVDPERRTQIAVMRSDGIVMARVPYVEGQVGNSVAHGALFRDGLSRSSEGVLRHRSAVDGSDRLSAFRRLDEWPLVLMVGLGGDDINREWARGTAYFAILPLLFMSILTRMHFRHRRQLQLADAANQALKENEQRFRSLFDEAPVGHIVNRLSDGRFVAANPAFCAITGYTAAELGRLSYQDITPASHAEDDNGQLVVVGSAGRYGPYRKQFTRKDGSRVAVRLSGSLISAPDGEPQILSVVEDISGYQQAENRIRLLASVFDHSGECLMVTDHENRIVEVNHAFTAVTGYAPEEVIGQNPRILASGRSCPAEYRNMWESIRCRGSWQGEVWDRHKDGHVYPKWLTISVVRDEEGRITHHIGSFTDITERKAAEERIHYLAHHDALTQLPNRFHLHGRLDQALAMAHRENRQAAVMFIDMDRFKDINDTLGHHVGDFLLVEVAQRLRESVRESDIVARLGGDEFVVVLTQVDDAAVPALADKLLHRLGEPYRVADQALHSTPSIGIGLYPKDGESTEELMKNADTAMYHAKAMGRNNYQFFAPSMNEATAERLALEGGLRRALERGEFQLHYQPQVDVASGRVVGVEALVRWQHPDKGLVPPIKFVPVAEDTGLILPLGRWVIGEALAQLAAWRRDGIALERMAVNLSAHQLRDASLQEFIISQLARHGLDGRSLELEITESVAMQHPECTIAFLNALRAEGIELAIDDFGTGYSSLAYLKRLPLDRLKLDRSFVMDIEHDSNDATISAATISLAHSLGLAVVAEGVETTAQLDFLRGLACDFAQGYHFSRPLPAAECTAFMRREMADVDEERG